MNVVQLGKIITGFNKDAELRGPGKKGRRCNRTQSNVL